ncbi:MAG: GTPase ObgE [Oscillospiraceae bacterium]|nr:GTPase ObgE [Oscillospiraceae bacterium]
MFVDQARIKIKAGDGGDGVVSFHREKYVAAGGPDGGDGGNGGNIVFQVDDNFSTLIDFRYKRKYVAPNGENGGAKRCTGKSAPDLVIRVPRGTLVKEAETGRILADMSDDVPHVLARGGRGGKGNFNFATSTRQIPKFAKPGFPGESFDVTLELKLLADVGLVGFPNVGKSTLISVVSAAKPKIANYHFTTLTPVLGVVRLDEERSFVMADIPGLIEGASEGTGLGHEFLRHVERCRLILHVLDVSGSEGRNPAEDFEKINQELANFSESLAECPQIVVANKSDMATPEQIAKLEEFIKSKNLKFYTISAATTKGTRELMQIVSEELSKLPPVKIYAAQPLAESDWETRLSSRQEFEIEIEDHIYYISAPWLEPILRTVNMEDYSSLQYFQRVLRSSGIIDKLEELGIQEGDTVNIFGFEFDYIR